MRMPVLLATLFVLMAAPARADEKTAEARFHEAYVQEVIDGEVAAAARVYLGLMEATDATPRLRREARFRFAVCAVLLGRADEGRAHLDALLADQGTPADLRARVETYRGSISGLGVGTELQRKLQSLVFDLARVNKNNQPEAYRDFEVIGDAALPFLRNLLGHKDEIVRFHAFRVLLRMDEPGMAARWLADATLDFPALRLDLVRYLKRHPKERDGLEKRALEEGADALERLVRGNPRPPFTASFVRQLAARGLPPSQVVALSFSLQDPKARTALLSDWLASDNPEFAEAALFDVYRRAASSPLATAELYPRIVRYILDGARERGLRTGRKSPLEAWSRRVPVPLVLETVDLVLDEGSAWKGPAEHSPLVSGILSEFAHALDGMELSPEHVARYAEQLRRWIAMAPRLSESLEKAGHAALLRPLREAWATHVGAQLPRLPEPEALAYVRWLFAGPAHAVAGHNPWAGTVFAKVESPHDVRTLAAAMKVVSRQERPLLAKRFPFTRGGLSREMASALADAVVALLGVLGTDEVQRLMKGFPAVLTRLPPERRADVSLAVVTAARTQPPQQRTVTIDRLASHDVNNPSAFRKIALPLLRRKWDALDVFERRRLLSLCRVLLTHRGASVDLGPDRAEMVQLLRDHLDTLQDRDFHDLADHPRIVPTESWLRFAPASALSYMNPTTDVSAAADALGRSWIEAPRALREVELRFVRERASDDVRRAFLAAHLTSDVPGHRETGVKELAHRHRSRRGGTWAFRYPVEADTLEKAVALELAMAAPRPPLVRELAKRILPLRPTKRLFPAARLLLSSKDRDDILAGIQVASSLGREDLVEALRPLLVSMDAQVRGQAKKALDAIAELTRLR